ncbi:MAG: nucleotidyltransferase domain-containing protein [Proteobacteria bacterium]|nr:nucleotidyltransferase domain-containing protein [Pseudomonadota bacterium]NBP16050.1 nucleotidyltransferase domain-containing protein [bacterium]
MIALEQSEKKIIWEIIKQYPYQFYIFGSRIKGTAKKFSDLDICVKGPISRIELFNLKSDFDDSDLPYKIDLSWWDDCTKEFKEQISNQLLLITQENLGL